MVSLLALTLAAAPFDVIVLPEAPVLAREVTAALGQRRVRDESVAWTYLFAPPGGVLGQDFEAFTAAPPPWWPAPLHEAWRRGVAHCRDLAGPPPWKQGVVATAMTCGRQLSTFLWDRLVQHHQAETALVFRGQVEQPNGAVKLRGERSAPFATTRRSLESQGSDAKAMARSMVAALVANQGTESRREVVAVFPPTPAPAGLDLLADEPVIDGAVPGVACATGPASLEVTPASVLSSSLAKRWASTVKAAGPALRCTLEVSLHTEDTPPLGPISIFSSGLRCGDLRVAAEAARSPMAKGTVAERLSTSLIKALAQQACR